MKTIFVLLVSILTLTFSCSDRVYAHSYIPAHTHTIQKTSKIKSLSKQVKYWKIQKRHKNPAPIFLVIMIVAAIAALAVYFLNMGVVIAAILGGIAFIAFILYFVYSGAN
ncbi:MAG: hypothetical protein NZ455_10420 [Bacteroidia bacterium]|nr:hypothetical protein [Bacteroidia bacterium]MDW8346230.1 hypothetical protein [Bacteroidia bacterium]